MVSGRYFIQNKRLVGFSTDVLTDFGDRKVGNKNKTWKKNVAKDFLLDLKKKIKVHEKKLSKKAKHWKNKKKTES